MKEKILLQSVAVLSIFMATNVLATSRQVDFNSGQQFSREIFGISLAFDRSNYHESDPTSIRGVSGGLYGDTYDWKNHVAIVSPGANGTTLRLLERCRDFDAVPLIQVNWRGIVSENGGVVTDTNINTLTNLAADWVTYCNYIAPYYYGGDSLPANYQALIDELNWGSVRTLSDANDVAVPRVDYWIIGNEPSASTYAAGGYWCDSKEGGTLNYRDRYIALTNAMFNADPTIKVGPGAHLTVDCVKDVLADTSNCHLDFIVEHIYSMLGDNWPNWAQLLAGPSYYIPNMESGLRNLSSSVSGVITNRRNMLAGYGRNPNNIEFIIGEWNPTMYAEDAHDSMYQGLAVAETLFTFMEDGIDIANYWAHLSDYDTQTLYPSYFVMNELRKNAGDTLVDVYRNNNIRIYSTKDSNNEKAAVWILNFSNSSDTTVNLSLSNLAFEPVSALEMTYGKVSGSVQPLLAGSSNTQWQGGYIDNFDPSLHTVSVPRASFTMLVVKGRTTSSFDKALGNRSGIANSQAMGINNVGQLVGNYSLRTGREGLDYTRNWAFTYSDNGFDSPRSYPTYTQARFYDINNNSLAVGMQQGWGGATAEGHIFDLKTGLWYRNFGEGVRPRAINDNNIVAGFLVGGGGSFIFNLDTEEQTNLGICEVRHCVGMQPVIYAINNDNIIVGGVAEASGEIPHAVIYRVGTGESWFDLGTIGDSRTPTVAFDINDNGVVVGFTNNVPFYTSDVSVEDANDIQLFALGQYTNEDGDFPRTFAMGINNSGVIVGMSYARAKDPDGAYTYQEILAGSLEMATYAVIWNDAGEAINLNERVLNASGWDLRQAFRINDEGVIAATGISPEGRWEAVLLYPDMHCTDGVAFYSIQPLADFGGPGGAGDFDCIVDLYDLEIFVSNWLKCSDPLDPECDQYWLN